MRAQTSVIDTHRHNARPRRGRDDIGLHGISLHGIRMGYSQTSEPIRFERDCVAGVRTWTEAQPKSMMGD